MKNSISVVLVIVCAFILFILVSGLVSLFADDAVDHANTPNANLSSTNIGAYYDELWEATRIFRTGGTNTAGEVIYRVTTSSASNFTTPTDPTVTMGNVSLPQHTVVTEWDVSGHVHFPN